MSIRIRTGSHPLRNKLSATAHPQGSRTLPMGLVSAALLLSAGLAVAQPAAPGPAAAGSPAASSSAAGAPPGSASAAPPVAPAERAPSAAAAPSAVNPEPVVAVSPGSAGSAPAGATASVPSTEPAATSGAVSVQNDTAQLTPLAVEPAEEKGEAKANKKKKNEQYGDVVVRGRVFTRAAFVTRDQETVNSSGMLELREINSLDLSVPSARIKVEYQAPLKWLSAEIEAEFAGRPELKDGYVQARSKTLSSRMGNFKMPFSAISMESPWKLPMVDRGRVHDFLSDLLQVGGRRAGVTVGARSRDGIRPELVLGAFQGSVLVDTGSNETEPAAELFIPSQSWVARSEIRLADLKIAANYQHRMGTPALFESKYYWTAGMDFVLDTVFDDSGLRLWLEGMAGASWLEHEEKPADDQDATFVAVRTIAAYRFGGVEERDFYVEPYGMLSVLDPDQEVTSDFVWEEAIGVNVGLWDFVRVGLQGESVRAERNFPNAYVLGVNPDRLALLLQAGLTF